MPDCIQFRCRSRCADESGRDPIFFALPRPGSIRDKARLRGRRGLEPLDADLETFTNRLNAENHTRKRALTDPGLISGIGNACSDRVMRNSRRGKVTAIRPGFAAQGRCGKLCPDCGASVQRIVFARSETNHCALCHSSGKLLADRALSRLPKKKLAGHARQMNPNRCARVAVIVLVALE